MVRLSSLPPFTPVTFFLFSSFFLISTPFWCCLRMIGCFTSRRGGRWVYWERGDGSGCLQRQIFAKTHHVFLCCSLHRGNIIKSASHFWRLPAIHDYIIKMALYSTVLLYTLPRAKPLLSRRSAIYSYGEEHIRESIYTVLHKDIQHFPAIFSCFFKFWCRFGPALAFDNLFVSFTLTSSDGEIFWVPSSM